VIGIGRLARPSAVRGGISANALATVTFSLAFSREQANREADRIGVELAARAGTTRAPPSRSGRRWLRSAVVARSSSFSTHPAPASRHRGPGCLLGEGDAALRNGEGAAPVAGRIARLWGVPGRGHVSL